MTGVLDDRDDVGAVGGHVDQVATRAVGEFDGENGTGRTDDISDVGDRGTGSGTEVEDLAAGLHVDVLETTEDTCCQLGSERVPDAVLGLGGDWGAVGAVGVAGAGSVDADALFAVNGLAGCEVLGGEEIFLAAGDEDTGMSVRLL